MEDVQRASAGQEIPPPSGHSGGEAERKSLRPLDSVQPEARKKDRVNSAYAASEGGNSEAEAEDPGDAQEVNEKNAASTPAPVQRCVKPRKFNYELEVRQAVTRQMPSLRTQRKHLDAEGNPLSRLAVDRQMTVDVLKPYEKEEWHSKAFGEDEQAGFEKVRMMFIHDEEARKYFGANYKRIALKEIVANIEGKRRSLEQDGEESDSAADLGDVGAQAQLQASSSDAEDDGESLREKKRRRMGDGLYKPQPMKEGTKRAIQGMNELLVGCNRQ